MYHRVMYPKDADGMANSVDPDQTAPGSTLIMGTSPCENDLAIPALVLLKNLMFTFSTIKCELIKQLYNINLRRLPIQHREVSVVVCPDPIP